MAPSDRRAVLLYYVLFFVTGTATVLQASVLPLLATSAQQPEAVVGRALAVQFTGQLLGALLPFRRALRGLGWGAMLVALACGLLLLQHPTLYLPALLAYGVGLGIAMTLTNIIVAAESPHFLRTSRLEMLNVFWPLGAAFCPWWLSWLAPESRIVLPLASIGLVFASVALGALRAGSARQVTSAEERSPSRKQAPRLVRLAMLALLAVGMETGAANWMPTFQARYLVRTLLTLPLATVFWLGILFGRVAASSRLRGRTPRGLVPGCSLVAGACLAVLIVAENRFALYAAAAFASISIGPLYPALLSEAVRLRWKGFVFASAGVGSALLPWLVGRFALTFHSLRTALGVLVAGCILLAAGSIADRATDSAPES